MSPALHKVAWTCVASAALASCAVPAVGPNYKRPDVVVPASWRVDAGEAAAATNARWWQGLGDADLDGLVGEALAANADLLIAAARVDEFAAKLEGERSHYFPQVGYDASFKRDQRSKEVPELLQPGQPPTFNQYGFGGTVGYEFDFWGRMRRANEAARAELLSSQEARHTVMLTVVANVASSYVELLELDNELAMAQQQLASLRDSLALTQQKFAGGSATDLDVARARADLAEQAAVIPELERAIATLENGLSTLVGRNPGRIQRGSIDKLKLIAVPQGVPSDVLTRRPDVMAAEAALRAANARIGVAKGEYFPKFALTGYLGQSSDLVRWLLAKTATAGLLDLDLAGPILSFGKVQGTVREARAVTRQEEQRYLQAVRNAVAEVDNALVFNAKATEHLTAVGEQLAARRQVASLSQARFEGGSGTNLDVLNAQRGVYEARVLQGQGMRDQYLALIAVYKALGGGWMVAEDSKAVAQSSAVGSPIAASAKFPTTTHDADAQ